MRLLALLLLLLLPAPVLAQAPAAAGVPQTDEEKTLYAVGLVMSRSLRQFDLSPAEIEFIHRALVDARAGKPAVDLDEWGPKIQALVNERGARVVAREKEVSAGYLAKAAAETGAVKTESGIVYTETSAGTGASPTAEDRVRVHYRGTLINGTEFDSSYSRNEPAVFPLSGVIRCWTEGVQRMKVGGKARLVCPSELAYGDRGNEAIPGGAALVFEVELLELVVAVAPPAN
jgi:FKBP-type peptidyl-prolyl cis-trans isomerase FkpA